jgi:hypothetical protein
MNAVATVDLLEQPIDFGRPFIPHSLTPLAHTAAWQHLEPHHRLRFQLQAELEQQTRALTADARYRRSIYSREVTPRPFALFDQWPEFRVLESAMPGYRYLGGLVA